MRAKIVDAPLVGVLTSLLVLEKRLKKAPAEIWVEIQVRRPRREDYINGVHVSIGRNFFHKDLDVAIQRTL
jgi:hypothetical protein